MASAVDVDTGSAVRGLDEAQVEDRRARGLTNDVPDRPSRTVGEIVRANVFTRFNALLGGLFVVILVVGESNDALFGGVLIANTLIGVVQELRAKRSLDRLAVLSAPHAVVQRRADGDRVVERELTVRDVVLDDVLVLRPGDQVVVDGELLDSSGLEVDESLLTGEADPVSKQPGDEVLSGSFVAAGTGRYRATRVGHAAYAVRLAEEARKFTLVHSELYLGVDRIIRLVSFAMVPTAVLLISSQLLSHNGLKDAVAGAVAGLVGMVPEGLVLLTSIAFAMSVVRLGRRRVLVQELPAVETLARVDVVCLDKTGTLTEGAIALQGTEVLDHADPAEVAAALAALVAVDPNPNATLQAIREGGGDPGGWHASAVVAFSSARKWSAAHFDGRGTWVLGGPDVVLSNVARADTVGQTVAGHDSPTGPGADAVRTKVTSAVHRHAAEGRRVLVLATTPGGLTGEALPDALTARALVLLDDDVRAEAPGTLRYFADQGVAVKVISGDQPHTVAAIARRAGLDSWGEGVDGRTLPTDPDELGEVVEAHAVFGGVSPQQKQAMVAALQRRGHCVAMTGDGVNDVLALKDADIGIAMGSGSSAARAAAQLVLLDGSFAALPPVVAEGRRVINNIERVANLFLTKTVYSMLLALAIGIAGWPFPFLPRHVTLIGSLTIGAPGFFLALAPNNRRSSPGFVVRVLRFALPAGTLAATATLLAYGFARWHRHLPTVQARTTAALVVASVGLLVLLRLAWPLTRWRALLVAAMAGLLTLAVALPFSRTFFRLRLPPLDVCAMSAMVVAITEVGLRGWLAHARNHAAAYERRLSRLIRVHDV